MDLSSNKVVVGESVSVTCHVTSGKEPISLVTWMKKVEDSEVEIGTNNFVNPIFKDTKRYTATLNYDKNKPEVIVFVLNITGRRTQNWGFLCVMVVL